MDSTMLSSDVEFLQNQVQRLNSVLTLYQTNSSANAASYSQFAESDEPVPWLTDRSILSPLLVEYDKLIDSQQQEIRLYKKEQAELRNTIKQLIAENERLFHDFKDSLPSELPPLEDDALRSLTNDEQLVQTFQQQLQLSLQEKEILEEKWRIASQEIDRLELELCAEKESHQWQVVEQQAHQVKDQYMQTVAALNKEIENLQTQLRETRTELNSSNLQLAEVRKIEAELKQQLIWKDQEQADIIYKDGISDSRVRELKRMTDELRQRVSMLQRELDEVQTDKRTLEARVIELQKKTVEFEAKESDYVQQVREAVAMVENATLEKDQAELECHQKGRECEQLQEVINRRLTDIGVHARQEVDKVKKQFNERICKLTDEIHSLEMINMELKSQQERLLRDKRAAESELEKIYKDGSSDGSKYEAAYQELNHRAIDAERARDEAEHKNQIFQNLINRLEMEKAQLASQVESELSLTKDRLKSMEMEQEDLNSQRLQLLDDMNRLKTQLQEAVKEKEAANRNCMKESVTKEQDILSRVREYEVKLQATEDTNRQAMLNLRKLLSAQQRMSARWKEECHSITLKLEVTVSDLRSEISLLKKRNAELCALLKESQEKSADAERLMSEYASNIRRMESQVIESQQQAHNSRRKLMRHLERERLITCEQQSLLQELGQSQRDLQSSRALRTSGYQATTGHLSDSQRSAELTNGHATGRLDVDDLQSER